MSDTDVNAIVDVAMAAAEPSIIDPKQRYAVIVPDSGDLQVIEPVPDAQLEAPRRLKGSLRADDVDTLKVLWDKYSDEGSELYADESTRTITAVFDADLAPNSPRHRSYRAHLKMELDAAWVAWSGVSGKWMSQLQFAEFLEDRAIDVETPSPGDVLDLAQHFEATSSVDFKSVERTSSSARTLVFEETVKARAGQAGNLEIPTEFVLILRPYVASAPYRVVARFRYRLQNGQLSLCVVLTRPEDVMREAFRDVVALTSEALSRTVLLGSPAAPVG